MIVAKNISYRIGQAEILNDVSVELAPGVITAILGPNGAGKSTLLKCLTGALVPNAGQVTVDGKPLADYALSDLSRRRAVLSQSQAISFPFSVMEIVMMGRHPHIAGQEQGRDFEAAREALESVDAWHLKDRVFPTLSGGEQQRVQLARVLTQISSQQKAFLFLDEPTSALDLKHQHQILGLVQQMCAARAMVVCLIVHDLNLALLYAERTILMHEGSVFASGETRDVLCADNIVSVFEISPDYVFGVSKDHRKTG